MIILTLDIVVVRVGIADMHVNVLVLRRQSFEMFLHDMLFTVPQTIKEVAFPGRAGIDDAVDHAQNRRHPDAAADQDHRRVFRRIEEEVSARRLDVQYVAFSDLILEVVRR